jgi:hypothetical protein
LLNYFRDGKTLAQAFPVFNQDAKWYSPAFILDMDKVWFLVI